MQQALAQGLRLALRADAPACRGLPRIDREVDVRIFIVDEGTENTRRQAMGGVAELLARLVELFGHLCRRVVSRSVTIMMASRAA